jgi:hypothetical protein
MAEPISEAAFGSVPEPEKARGWRYWLRRLLVCNPFFLCSAALLLWGVNRLSTDPGFPGDETQNLLFNFFALEGYELMVVFTAIVLARRKVWYDSALLSVLENGLVVVPFMLISQASLIGGPLATSLTLAGGALAVSRFAGVRRWYPQFNLPPQALGLGTLLLAANVVLPRIFRPWIELDVADWQHPNQLAWWVALPLLAAGANLLPRPLRYGGLNPERHWLPLFCYGLWLVGSAVHVWCLQHICALPFEFSQLAPLIFVCAWTFRQRIGDCLPVVSAGWSKATLLFTAVTPLLAWESPWMFVALSGANVLAYVALSMFGTESIRSLAQRLAVLSCALLLSGCPLEWGRMVFPAFSRLHAWLSGVALYTVLRALRSPRLEWGLAGGIWLGLATAAWARSANGLALGFQVSLVFALAHSLSWNDQHQRSAGILRKLLGGVWFLFCTLYAGKGTLTEVGIVGGAALFLLGAWCAFWWWRGERPPWVLPVCATLTLLAAPGPWLVRVASVGLVALIGSLLLFVLGSVVAWTKPRWIHGGEPSPPSLPGGREQDG